MCITREIMNQKMEEIQSWKKVIEEAEANIRALERDVIEFLSETEDYKTTNKKGKAILEFVGNLLTATYAEQQRETVNKDEVKKLLSAEDYQKVCKISTFNVLRIAIFGYLKGIQAYHRQKDKKYDLFFMCWQYLRAEMGNHFRMENTMKRKPLETVLSLDVEYSEMENLYSRVGGKSLEDEILELEELEELLENFSEVQRKIAEMKMDGYKSKEIYVVLDLKPATYFREVKQMKAILESLVG